MNQSYIIFLLLVCIIISTFLQSCSKNSDTPVKMITTIVEKDANDRNKVSIIEYNNIDNSSGDDEIYGTSDDEVLRYFVINEQGYLNDSSNKAKLIAYDSPGEDKLWFSADDRIQYSTILEHNNEKEKFFAKFNFDWLAGYGDQNYINELSDVEVLSFLYLGVWPNIDDNSLSVNQSIKYSESPLFSGVYLGYSSVDVYKTFTLDEKVVEAHYDKQIYNEILGIYNFAIDYYSEKSTDPTTGIETIRYSNSPGVDTKWFNNDDEFDSGFTRITKDNSPLPKLTTLRYSDPGADGKWFTEDDLIHSREVSTFDSNNNLLTYNYVFSGNDGLLDTSDDNIWKSYRQLHEIDRNEHRITRKHVENFGTLSETVIWADIGVYNLDANSHEITGFESSALLTPEGFSYYQNSIINTTNGNEDIGQYERKHVSKPITIEDSDIEDVFSLVDPKELTLTSEKKIATVSLENGIYKSFIETRNLETGLNESSTYIKILRNQN